MEQVFKIFFRGIQVVRIKNNSRSEKFNIESNLAELSRQKIVTTRIRLDTKVKQYNAGNIFEYLQTNLAMRSNECLLVLTNVDLYPKEGWTFVFGMTKQSWRICIQSYARHHPNFANL